jgi:hypothetical protein
MEDRTIPHSTMTLETKVVASDQQVACDVGDETVILNLKDGVYYGLNPVAAVVWRSLSEARKVEELRNILIEEFDVGKDQCTEDLFGLLSQLLSWDLVEIRNGEGLAPH